VCKSRCEDTVARLNNLLDSSSASYPLARGTYLRSAILFLVFALPVLVMGLFVLQTAKPTAGYIVLFFGAFLLLFSLSYFRAAYGYWRAQNPETTNKSRPQSKSPSP